MEIQQKLEIKETSGNVEDDKKIRVGDTNIINLLKKLRFKKWGENMNLDEDNDNDQDDKGED